MQYSDQDIQYANRILNRRGELDDREVEEWMSHPGHLRLLDDIALFRGEYLDEESDKELRQASRRLEQALQKRRRRKIFFYGSVAASILLIVGIWGLLRLNDFRNAAKQPLQLWVAEPIPPGKPQAELILNDGSAIVLTRENISIATEEHSGIRNDSLDGLDYTHAQADVSGKGQTAYHTLKVPVGGFYRIVLPDGTEAWLNSDSELRYPVVFDQLHRTVYLKGEAYFEVVPDKERAFVVALEQGEITVLGTSFNVNAYGDDGKIYTTLASGSVRFVGEQSEKAVFLQPGMQCVMEIEGGTTSVRRVDPEHFVSWRYGYFFFEEMSLETIMYQLQRWYDIEVEFAEKMLKSYKFRGVISRDMNLDVLLEIIKETTHIDFKITGRKVTVVKR